MYRKTLGVGISFALLGVMMVGLLFSQGYAIHQTSFAEEELNALLGIVANQDYPSDVRKAAFETLRTHSPKTEPHFITYCSSDEVRIAREVPSDLYGEIVQSMTISCIDAFVYNFETKTYLMIQRATPPVKGMWWMPGGRIFKGESFYESASRKTKKESGIDICPIAQLGTYSTYFAESAWGSDVHTDTKNTVVLALCDNQKELLDEYHEDMKWVPINTTPEDPYLLAAYKEAKAKLTLLGFTN